MRHHLIPLLVLAALVCTPVPASADPVSCTALPANIIVPGGYQQWIETIIERSPTLQRQCLAIASAEHVVVRLRSTDPISGDCRATTSFSRDRTGRLRAVVSIPVSVDFAELLAHEFEHVVEQIEGLNLRRLARSPESGVREIRRNVFETQRATDAGLMAAMELVACHTNGTLCGERILMVASKD